MQFLVVDDSITIRRIVTNTLHGLGYTDILEAEDGIDALEKLGNNPVDFVITDWNMPNMSGLDLTQSIRTSAAHSKIPILMITTRGAKEDIMEALKMRVSNYLVKPFTPELLKQKIDEVLKVA